MPIFEAVEVSYSTEYEQVSGTEVKCTGISVVSENGATVASAKFPAGYYAYSTAPDIYLYDLDDTAFLVVSLREDDNSAKDDCYVVYELTDGGSSLKMVGTPMSVGVSPRAPRIGENVTVSLGEPAGKDCFVEVVSSTGRTVLRRKNDCGRHKHINQHRRLQQRHLHRYSKRTRQRSRSRKNNRPIKQPTNHYFY